MLLSLSTRKDGAVGEFCKFEGQAMNWDLHFRKPVREVEMEEVLATSRAKYDHIIADEEDERVGTLENLTRPLLHPESNYSFGSPILSLDGLDVFNYFKSKFGRWYEAA